MESVVSAQTKNCLHYLKCSLLVLKHFLESKEIAAIKADINKSVKDIIRM